MASADVRMRFIALRMPFAALRMRLGSGVSDVHTGIWILYARVRVSRPGGCDPRRENASKRRRFVIREPENTIRRTENASGGSADAIECHATDTCSAADAICSAADAFRCAADAIGVRDLGSAYGDLDPVRAGFGFTDRRIRSAPK